MNNRSGSTIIPCLRYRDAHAAIDWLCRAFGFVRQAVYEDGAGGIVHAQLTYGAGMVMLGSARDDELGRHLRPPTRVDGHATQCTCVVVPDCHAHYDQARACGAAIVTPYADRRHGGAGYSCRDPEGHLWWFGSYDPWKDDGHGE